MSLVHIERQTRRARGIPLTPLVDIVCNLLIFFMLSTSFTKLETMELILPSSEAAQAVSPDVLYVRVSNNGEIFLGNDSIDRSALPERMGEIVSKKPDQRVMVLVADKVSVQTLITVMDRISNAGGRNVSVSDWRM